MTEPTREEKLLSFGRKAESAFQKSGTRPGCDLKLGRFTVCHVPEVGIWVYAVNEQGHRVQIYGHSAPNMHADHGDTPLLEEARDQFLRLLILEELADV